MNSQPQLSMAVAQTILEGMLIQLSSDMSAYEHKCYMAGCIDMLLEINMIDGEAHDALYAEYAF